MHLKVKEQDCDLYDCIDLNTNQRIPLVQEANDETGELSIYLRDSDNNDLIYDIEKKEYVLFKFKGNIKLIKKQETEI